MPAQQRERTGVVVSDRMNKTVVVVVERLIVHAKYKKRIKSRAKYKAHDEQNRCRVGDRVRIVETRPLSREKRWAVRSVIGRAQVIETTIESADESGAGGGDA